jgi:hypothetical protein
MVNPGSDVPHKKKERKKERKKINVSGYNTNYVKIIHVKSIITNYRENFNDICYISL